MEKKGLISLLPTRYSLLAILITIATMANAQEAKMKDIFSSMPDSIIPYLSHNNRLDMIDFRESSMEAVVDNSLEGKSKLDTLTADYLHLTLNEATSVEMKLLESPRLLDDTTKTIVCVATTYANVESSVEFFTSKWHRLAIPLDYDKQSLIARPDTMDAATFDSLRQLASDFNVVAKLLPSSIELKPTFPKISADDNKRIEALKRKIVLKYDNLILNFLNY